MFIIYSNNSVREKKKIIKKYCASKISKNLSSKYSFTFIVIYINVYTIYISKISTIYSSSRKCRPIYTECGEKRVVNERGFSHMEYISTDIA